MIQFTCEKALLKNAISTAGKVTSPKSSIPALEGLLLKADSGCLTVSGYNMQTGIRTKLDVNVVEPGEIVLPYRLFSDIVTQMPDDMITFSANDRLMVRLSCLDTDIEILGLAAEEYPEIPEVEDEFSVSLQQKTLKEMIEQVSFAVSTNESRPVHTGALFEIADNTLTMVAVDGFRLAVRREALEKMDSPFSFVAPGSSLSEVRNICKEDDKAAEITLGKRHILFTIGSTDLICRRLEGEFLDYRTAIPRKNPVSVTVETRALTDSISRVSTVISEKLKSPIRCVFEKDRVMLSAKTARGDAKDVCVMSGDGGGLEIGFNNRYLMEALRYAPADAVRIELNTGVSPAVIIPVEGEEKFLYMVLPVRLKAK